MRRRKPWVELLHENITQSAVLSESKNIDTVVSWCG